jgi:hypothetical protein
LTKAPPEGSGSISIEGGPACRGETCTITIRGENNFLLNSVDSLFGMTSIDATHSYMTILGDGGISDVIMLDTTNASSPPGTPDQGAILTFLSDPNLTGFSIAPGSPVENGSLQHLLSLSWKDLGNTADVADIWVASDIPEASTWVMMLAGFAGLGFAGYRSRTRASA